MIRVKTDTLVKEDTRTLCYSVLSDSQKVFSKKPKSSISASILKTWRAFGPITFSKKVQSAPFFVKFRSRSRNSSELGLPPALAELVNLAYGLVLVTGPTGSGKSTTIASMIDKINEEQSGHIMTLEDPIEFVHNHKASIVNQREIGADSDSFAQSMRHLLRQDPDVCLLGEMRDLETIETALTTAETGHLVFATLHTNGAVQTINRIVGVFPSEQQDRIRIILSFVLQAVVSQQLLPTLSGGRVACIEFLQLTPAIRNLIRENKIHQIPGMMQMGQDKTGMVTMNQSLVSLVLKKKIDIKTAYLGSPEPEQLDQMLKKAGV